MMSDRDVWVKAGAIVGEYGTGAAAYIITQLWVLSGIFFVNRDGLPRFSAIGAHDKTRRHVGVEICLQVEVICGLLPYRGENPGRPVTLFAMITRPVRRYHAPR